MAEELERKSKANYQYRCTERWDQELWTLARPVYEQGFAEHGRKPESILRRMFDRQMCSLHVMLDGPQAAAMALSGTDVPLEAVIIDYLAVDPKRRGQGLGGMLLERIAAEAQVQASCRGIIVEAEAEESPENLRRIRFWENGGFTLTEYVHSYIWVPETYRAMARSFPGREPLPEDGRVLFGAITRFHERAYSK
jgi:GNAT superfamily N-acetyltransferase